MEGPPDRRHARIVTFALSRSVSTKGEGPAKRCRRYEAPKMSVCLRRTGRAIRKYLKYLQYLISPPDPLDVAAVVHDPALFL